MKLFDLDIVTPEGKVFSDKVYQLLIRGVEGDVSILASHIPYITALKGGECRVYKESGNNFRYAKYEDGVLYAKKDKVTVLTSGFKWSGE